MPDFKNMDIGMKMTIGVATATAGAAMICVPNRRQKEQAALDLFDKPLNQLSKQDQKVAEFKAGYKRWTDFFQGTVYPITRSLPGSKTPLLNPYRDQEGFAAQDDDE